MKMGLLMDELIKLLDPDLEYINHEIIDDEYFIKVASTRHELYCPFCGQLSSKTHSKYERTFHDLPIQGRKVTIIINNRKMFCMNTQCTHTTFAERFDFLHNKAKKTKRLEEEIVRLSLNCSSVAASEILKKNFVDVGKSTICNLLKKRRTNN